MKKPLLIYEKMCSVVYIFECWDDFIQGKRQRLDIQQFQRNIENHIFQLQEDIISLEYQHGFYTQFHVLDPKQRRISKASVRDRFVHHIVHRLLSPIFDKQFICHSLSSRKGKGTHFGMKCLEQMINVVSCSGKRSCHALKMDIRRFFDSINHQILKTLIRRTIWDKKALIIINLIIDSFKVANTKNGGVGIPLGNVTSQLFANIYLNELDAFIKQTLREKHYLRYCDDFIILSTDENHLKSLISPISTFLKKYLHLEIHPNKLVIKKLAQGIDFIGYIHFFTHKILRKKTKQRMKKRLKLSSKKFLEGKISETTFDQQLQSYLGILSHANQFELSQTLKNAYWVR